VYLPFRSLTLSLFQNRAVEGLGADIQAHTHAYLSLSLSLSLSLICIRSGPFDLSLHPPLLTLLQVPADPEASFFAAGGSSLRLVELHDRLEHAFGRTLDIAMLFQHASLGAQAAWLEQMLIVEGRVPPAWGGAAVEGDADGQQWRQLW